MDTVFHLIWSLIWLASISTLCGANPRLQRSTSAQAMVSAGSGPLRFRRSWQETGAETNPATPASTSSLHPGSSMFEQERDSPSRFLSGGYINLHSEKASGPSFLNTDSTGGDAADTSSEYFGDRDTTRNRMKQNSLISRANPSGALPLRALRSIQQPPRPISPPPYEDSEEPPRTPTQNVHEWFGKSRPKSRLRRRDAMRIKRPPPPPYANGFDNGLQDRGGSLPQFTDETGGEESPAGTAD